MLNSSLIKSNNIKKSITQKINFNSLKISLNSFKMMKSLNKESGQ
jgi:hypothetical protein